MAKRLILKELSRYRIDTYADIIYRNALLHGDREAFICGRERVTFSRYNERVNALVHALYSLGLSKGDGIGILSWNCLECTDVNGAAMKGGFIVSAVQSQDADEGTGLHNQLFRGESAFRGSGTDGGGRKTAAASSQCSTLHIPRGFGARHGFVSTSLIEAFPADEPDVDVREDDKFIIFYTSGTTGTPRGAVYTHASKLREAKNKALQVGLKPENRHVMILPLFHIGGWSHFWAFFYVGASNVIMPKGTFDPQATLQAIQDEKATDIHIVPTHLVGMLATPDIGRYDLSSLERMWYAASPMPTELLRRGIATFGEVFAQGYGQSESGPDIAILSKESHRVLDKSPEEQKSAGILRPALSRGCTHGSLTMRTTMWSPEWSGKSWSRAKRSWSNTGKCLKKHAIRSLMDGSTQETWDITMRRALSTSLTGRKT